ncbi:MAG TPA: hypothetical protein DEA40_03645, partial [Parvularcula sp.]|nr:hypothetical protein [Parvularcula sp.]
SAASWVFSRWISCAGPPAAPPAPAPSPKPAVKAPPPAPQPPITIINERSFEAGYPDNPSIEEIEAIEAEADEVVTYLGRLGAGAADDDADRFFDDDSAPPARDPLDDLEDDFDEVIAAPASAAVAPAPALDGTVRAVVTASLGVRAFMRLTLGAAELRLPAEELIAEAIEEYLDARGVESLGGEEFFKKLAAASSRGPS